MSDQPASYLEIQLDQQPIELCKLLKIADLVAGGGEAKVVISEGYVLLNGEVECQKRKKIYHNDIIEFNGEIIQLQVVEPDELLQAPKEAMPKEDKPSQSKKKTKRAPSKSSKTKPTSTTKELNVTKRKPISF